MSESKSKCCGARVKMEDYEAYYLNGHPLGAPITMHYWECQKCNKPTELEIKEEEEGK